MLLNIEIKKIQQKFFKGFILGSISVGIINLGIATYRSLSNVCNDFTLYVFAFDDASYDALKRLNYENLIPISLAEFEDEKLLAIKSTRTRGEYCWTCTSSTIRYVLQNFEVNN